MIDLTDTGLSREIDNALAFRRKHTEMTRQLEEKMAGNWFSTSWQTDPQPENAIYSYVAWMLPAICFSNPQTRVKPRRVYAHKPIAEAMDTGFETLMQMKDLVSEFQLVCRDFLLGWGVTMVGMEDASIGERPQRLDAANAMHPFAQHLSRHKFFMDPACKKPNDSRLQGHQYMADRAALLANPRFDQELVKGLTSVNSNDSDAVGNQEKVVKSPEVGDRDMVELIDVWIREGNLICTLASAGDGQGRRMIRKPQPYKGPLSGPYTVFGCYTVADDPYPMGPVQPVMEQLEELQAHIRATSEEAGSFKTQTFVDAAATELARAIKDGPGGTVYTIKGLAATPPITVTSGEIHPQRMQHIMDMRQRVDRVMGIGDNQQGRLADVTASEAQITQANVDLRTEYIRSRWEKGVTEVLSKMGHFMFYSPLVVMSVTKTDPWGGGQQEGDFYGGVQPGQEGVRWPDDFILEVVSGSTGHTDDQIAQQRWLQLIQLVPTLSQMMMTMPYVNVRYIVDGLGETFNQPNLSETLFSPAMMAAFGQNPMAFGVGQPIQLPGMAGPQGGGPGGTGPGPAGTPRLPNKTGKPGTMALSAGAA